MARAYDTAPLRAIDLCCGAGGWACAARGTNLRIVLAVDLWDVCCRTYKLNHPGVDVTCGDLREPEVQRRILDAASAAGVDVVLGAIPCQWLTRKRGKNFNPVGQDEKDRERATLAAVLGLVEAIAPRYWCLEDVVGLAAELPPGIPTLELDSGNYSAQRRKRLYVGEFPRSVLTRGQCPRVMASELRPGPYRIGRRAADRKLSRAATFTADTAYAASMARKSPTICALGSRRDPDLVIVDPAIPGGRRQIEWQEAAGLQGFPADYVFYGSPTDVSLMVGQAVQIDTARTIIEDICADAAAAGAAKLQAEKEA